MKKAFKTTTETYAEKLAKETDRGDCCMMSAVEWGHARNDIREYVTDFDDEDHMNEVGEYRFNVNEMCLHNDHSMFLIYPNDNDSPDPSLVHLTPFDWTHHEHRQYVTVESKIKRKQTGKETKKNRRKKYQQDDEEWEQEDDQDDEEKNQHPYTLLREGIFTAWNFSKPMTSSSVNWQLLAAYSGKQSFTKGLMLVDKQAGHTMEITAEDCTWRVKQADAWRRAQVELLSDGATSFEIQKLDNKMGNAKTWSTILLKTHSRGAMQDVAKLRVGCDPHKHMDYKVKMYHNDDVKHVGGELGVAPDSNGDYHFLFSTRGMLKMRADREFEASGTWASLGGREAASAYLKAMHQPEVSLLDSSCSGAQEESGVAHWDLELAVEVRRCHWDLELAVEARQCSLPSAAASLVDGKGPAALTMQSWRLRAGGAHCYPEVTVEVPRCSLRSGAGIRGSGVLTAIRSRQWQLRSGSAHCDPELVRSGADG
eukprot:s1241_g1.t1